jgi:hypothetical protein
MDKTQVNLEICIKFENNANPYKETFTEFKSFKELKDISIKYFNIQEEKIKIMKFTFLEESQNKSLPVNDDKDLISCMKEKDEYNYIINLELLLDRTIEENKKKMSKLFYKKLKKEFSSLTILLKNWIYLKKILKEKIKNYIKNEQKTLFELLNEFPNDITLSEKENEDKINKINDNLFYTKRVRDISKEFDKKTSEIKTKQDNLKREIQNKFEGFKNDIIDLIKKNQNDIKYNKIRDINEIKPNKNEDKNIINNKNQGIKTGGDTKKPLHSANYKNTNK